MIGPAGSAGTTCSAGAACPAGTGVSLPKHAGRAAAVGPQLSNTAAASAWLFGSSVDAARLLLLGPVGSPAKHAVVSASESTVMPAGPALLPAGPALVLVAA